MNTPILIEIALGAGVFTAAALLTIPLRLWIRRVTGEKQEALLLLKNLLTRLALPLLVIILTRPAVWLLRAEADPGRLHFWFVFWLVILGINLVEGIALQAFALRRQEFPIPALLRNIIRFFVLLGVAFVILREMNVNISPLLASTALLTAVIGFALQGVLGNLLSGMSLHLTRSVMPGDWVEINNVEGRVIETNWRETRLRTTGGHIIVVPNSTVASSVVRNMTSPTPLRRHTFNVDASYSDAPGKVIEALLEAARGVPEVLHRPPPSAFVSEYKDFGINYVLRYWSQRFYDRVPIDGDVGRMIWYQFKRRGIEIPFPMSDKLLNDFMAVVYRQRRMPPEKEDVRSMARDLAASDLVTSFMADENGDRLLGREDVEAIAPSLRRVRYTAGETLFRQGEAGESCYVVVRGRFSGRMEFKEAVPANEFEIRPGALVGEMSLMTGLPRTATVAAQEESELLEINREAFRLILGRKEKIPELLSRLVAARAAANAEALAKLKAITREDVKDSVSHENIFKRFLRLLKGPDA